MAASTYFERRAIRNALETYLAGAGWTGLQFDEGFMSEKAITVPLVTIEIVKPSKASLQLGGGPDQLFKRNIQIDCYMESEPRAMIITDNIMDFMDMVPVQIVDNLSNSLGTIICYNTDSINADVLPPVMTDPTIKRWRGIVKGIWEAHYPNGT